MIPFYYGDYDNSQNNNNSNPEYSLIMDFDNSRVILQHNSDFSLNQYFYFAGTTAQPKRYVANLTQTSTNAPVATVLENSLGGTVVWTRSTNGLYIGTLAGAFTVGKTTVIVAPPYPATIPPVPSVGSYSPSVNTVQLNSDNTDNVLTYPTKIEITVYP